MIKKEITRIVAVALLGFFVALFCINSKNKATYYFILLLPVYFVGMFYAGRTLIKLIGAVVKTYFSFQFMSLLINPLWGTILCLLLLCLGVLVILSFGWLIGLRRCIYCVVTAYRLDQKYNASRNEYKYW